MNVSPRRSLRIPLPVQTIRVEDGGARFLGYLENVSVTGIFVQCARPRTPGARLALHLRLPGSACVLRAEAEVVWNRGYGGRRGPTPGMGLRFVDLANGVREEIAKFCAGSDPTPFPTIGVSGESAISG